MGEGAGRDALNSNPPLVVRRTPIWTASLGLGVPPEAVGGRRTAARAVPLADQGATPSSSCPPSPPPPPTRTTCRSRSQPSDAPSHPRSALSRCFVHWPNPKLIISSFGPFQQPSFQKAERFVLW